MNLVTNIVNAKAQAVNKTVSKAMFDSVRMANVNLQQKVALLTRSLDASVKEKVTAVEMVNDMKKQVMAANATIADLENKIKDLNAKLTETARKAKKREVAEQQEQPA